MRRDLDGLRDCGGVVADGLRGGGCVHSVLAGQDGEHGGGVAHGGGEGADAVERRGKGDEAR